MCEVRDWERKNSKNFTIFVATYKININTSLNLVIMESTQTNQSASSDWMAQIQSIRDINRETALMLKEQDKWIEKHNRWIEEHNLCSKEQDLRMA